jgi:hypothetical protein
VLIELLTRVGVNRPVLYSMLTRGTQGVAALIGIVLVGHFLDGTTQGYYFTILGFVAFVQLADFGLTYAVMQSASHEAAAVTSTGDGIPHGQISRQLAALLRGATRFNAATTILATLAIAGIGTRILMSGNAAGASASEWWVPWIASLASVGAGQLLNPRVSLLEGAGFVSAVWLFRLLQELTAALTLWTALIFGAGLWAIALSYASRVAVGLVWLGAPPRRRYFSALVGAPTDRGFAAYWRREVWPFQWRIGVSAMSGYLIFQFFTPLMFALRGPAIAGQFGMTLTLTNGLLTVTTAWLNSLAPRFGTLIATRSYDRLNQEFVRSVRSSFLVVLVIGAAMSAGLLVLVRVQSPLAQRLLPPGAFAFFVAATVINHLVFAMAIYLRAHRREPLLVSSVAGALITPIVVSYAARYGSTTAIAASYLVLTTIGLGVTIAIFVSRSRAWHAVPHSTPSISA